MSLLRLHTAALESPGLPRACCMFASAVDRNTGWREVAGSVGAAATTTDDTCWPVLLVGATLGATF